MNGNTFYKVLKRSLKQKDIVDESRKYSFIKWMKHGGLQYKINAKQNKSIPVTVIVDAFNDYKRGVTINYSWVKENRHNNWCTPSVLNYLIKKYC